MDIWIQLLAEVVRAPVSGTLISRMAITGVS
jgi:hypothetical protein